MLVPFHTTQVAAGGAVESFSFDPKSAIFLVGLYFYATVEACRIPPSDFHPILLPALRSETPPDRDGGAP